MLWSAIQDIIILIKCFLWGGAWASVGASGGSLSQGLIIGNNGAICINPGSRFAWLLGMRLSWTLLYFPVR